MSPNQFRAVRRPLGSQRKAAIKLGIGFRTLQRIEAGTYGDPIPIKYENMILGKSDRPSTRREI